MMDVIAVVFCGCRNVDDGINNSNHNSDDVDCVCLSYDDAGGTYKAPAQTTVAGGHEKALQTVSLPN